MPEVAPALEDEAALEIDAAPAPEAALVEAALEEWAVPALKEEAAPQDEAAPQKEPAPEE